MYTKQAPSEEFAFESKPTYAINLSTIIYVYHTMIYEMLNTLFLWKWWQTWRTIS